MKRNNYFLVAVLLAVLAMSSVGWLVVTSFDSARQKQEVAAAVANATNTYAKFDNGGIQGLTKSFTPRGDDGSEILSKALDRVEHLSALAKVQDTSQSFVTELSTNIAGIRKGFVRMRETVEFQEKEIERNTATIDAMSDALARFTVSNSPRSAGLAQKESAASPGSAVLLGALGSIVGLLGTASTLVLAWRKDARERFQFEQQLRRENRTEKPA